jgi:putative colanic acid biosynthesis acetyltransferase WcaF
MSTVDLSQYNNSWYHPGRSTLIRIIWHCVNALVLQNPLNTSSRLKVLVLRLFGATIGQGVNLKPSINIKYPWNINIGDYVWIGENVWLDSLAPITIRSHVCVSQGVYCCTGNHNWSDPAFGLIIKPITLETGAWVGARSVLLPGVTVGSHAVVTAGAILAQDATPYTIYAGNPAFAVKKRIIRDERFSSG